MHLTRKDVFLSRKLGHNLIFREFKVVNSLILNYIWRTVTISCNYNGILSCFVYLISKLDNLVTSLWLATTFVTFCLRKVNIVFANTYNLAPIVTTSPSVVCLAYCLVSYRELIEDFVSVRTLRLEIATIEVFKLFHFTTIDGRRSHKDLASHMGLLLDFKACERSLLGYFKVFDSELRAIVIHDLNLATFSELDSLREVYLSTSFVIHILTNKVRCRCSENINVT